MSRRRLLEKSLSKFCLSEFWAENESREENGSGLIFVHNTVSERARNGGVKKLFLSELEFLFTCGIFERFFSIFFG